MSEHCGQCGPGYRLGNEGCRHTAPNSTPTEPEIRVQRAINTTLENLAVATGAPTVREGGDVAAVLTKDEIDSLVYASGPDADYDALMDAVEHIIAGRERAAGARALREAASALNTTDHATETALSGVDHAINFLRDRAAALAPETREDT